METVFDLAYLAVFGLGALVLWRLCRDDRPAEEARAAEAAARVGLTPASPDDRPGTDAGALDFIELTYGMPAYVDPELEAGCERLWDAIRDEQQKETGDA